MMSTSKPEIDSPSLYRPDPAMEQAAATPAESGAVRYVDGAYMPHRRVGFRALIIGGACMAIVVALTAIFLAASNSSNPIAPLPDAKTLLLESAQTTRNLHSAHLKMEVDGELRDKLPFENFDGDLTNTPAAAAEGSVDIIVLGKTATGVGIFEIDDELYFAITKGNWSAYGSANHFYSFSVILDSDKGLANVLNNLSEPKSEGRENIGGVNTVRITGKVSADAFNRIVPQLQVSEPVPAMVWIREDGSHDLVRANLEAQPGHSIRMTFSKWNEQVTVTKPPGIG